FGNVLPETPFRAEYDHVQPKRSFQKRVPKQSLGTRIESLGTRIESGLGTRIDPARVSESRMSESRSPPGQQDLQALGDELGPADAALPGQGVGPLQQTGLDAQRNDFHAAADAGPAARALLHFGPP